MMSLMSAMATTYRSGNASREKIAQLQQKRLNKLVSYAKANSPYYRRLFADSGNPVRLADLPATSKPTMMANFDDVVTDRNVTMSRIYAFTQDLDNIGRMLDGKYLVFKTSGSTGNPAVVLSDKAPEADAISGKFKHVLKDCSFIL